MTEILTKNGEPRYIVICKTGIVDDYQHIDMKKCNELSKHIYNELQTLLLKESNEFLLDEAMITLAMTVVRLANNVNKDEENVNNWEDDAFPEFCSLIGPYAGWVAIDRNKEEQNAKRTSN